MNEVTNRKECILVYDIVRVMATILVVLGHSGYISISTNYGGVDYTPEIGLPLIYKCFNLLIEGIYLFHMPFFMALSGALFNTQHKKYKSDTGKLIKKKAKQLLVPFLMINILFNIPIKCITGYFNYGRQLYDALVGQIFLQGNCYLWYLPTLFLIYVIAIMCSKKFTKRRIESNISILFIIYIGSYFMNIYIIKNVMYYLLWFYIGFYFEENKVRLHQSENNIYKIILLCICYIFFLVIHHKNIIHSFIFERIVAFFSALVGCYLSFLVCLYLSKKTNIIKRKIFKVVHKYSMDIYLLSDPLNYVILFLISLIFGAKYFSNGLALIGMIIIRFIISLIIPVAIAKTVVRYK
jgi:fucose 4-O-acetylase-like acetyltransferase